MTKVSINSQSVKLSSLDKVLFPEAQLTKGDLIEYYRKVSKWMLPYLRDRPLTLQRFPDGIGASGFYQKDASDYFPPWIERLEVPKQEGGTTNYVLCQQASTLIYLANQGCVTPHIWLSRRDRLDRPDQMVFDLDPSGETADLGLMRRTALWLRDDLQEAGLTSFLKTSGSRGYHVHVPLDRTETFDAVRDRARAHAERLVDAHPDVLTLAQRKSGRGGKLFIDIHRNGWAQTAVAPYAVRARFNAPVAAPLAWKELERGPVDPRQYHIKNLFRRLAQIEDPWANFPAKVTAST